MVLVLFCISFFKDNIILKIILTIISGCTFVMIISSALRMFMYIERYNLTFLRIFVLWALAVIFLLMTGITIFIYKQNYPLFFYSVAIVTVFYIGLSFSHPDYWIARYNLNLVIWLIWMNMTLMTICGIFPAYPQMPLRFYLIKI